MDIKFHRPYGIQELLTKTTSSFRRLLGEISTSKYINGRIVSIVDGSSMFWFIGDDISSLKDTLRTISTEIGSSKQPIWSHSSHDIDSYGKLKGIEINSEFFRCFIEKIDETNALVRLVDTGLIQEIDIKNLYEIPSFLQWFPYQALYCTIDSKDRFTSINGISFDDIVGHKVSIKIIDMISMNGPLFLVEIINIFPHDENTKQELNGHKKLNLYQQTSIKNCTDSVCEIDQKNMLKTLLQVRISDPLVSSTNQDETKNINISTSNCEINITSPIKYDKYLQEIDYIKCLIGNYERLLVFKMGAVSMRFMLHKRLFPVNLPGQSIMPSIIAVIVKLKEKVFLSCLVEIFGFPYFDPSVFEQMKHPQPSWKLVMNAVPILRFSEHSQFNIRNISGLSSVLDKSHYFWLLKEESLNFTYEIESAIKSSKLIIISN